MKALLVMALIATTIAQAADETVKEFEHTGAAPQTAFQLKHEQKETIYETRQVPDTCTRQVLDGYDTECTPTTRRECSNEQVWECTPTTRRECSNTTRRECTTEYRQDCEWTTRRECSNTTRRECRDTTRRECSGGGTVCHDVPDQVCRTGPDGQQICQTVNRRVCEREPQECRDVPSTECRDVPDSVCRDVPDQVCRQVPYQSCHDVPDTVCRDVPDQDCGYVTREQCRDVPDQVCRQVPRYRTETYACQRTVQVPVGERLVLQTLANVTAKFQSTQVRPDEDFIAKLTGANVGLTVKKASGLFVISSKKKEEARNTDPTHRVVTTTFDVGLLPVAEVSGALAGGITDASLSSTQFSFNLGKVVHKQTLVLDVAIKHTASGREIVKGRIPYDQVTYQDVAGQARTTATVALSDLGVREPLVPGRYQLDLSAAVSVQGIDGLLNADGLAGVRPVTYSRPHVVTFDSAELNQQTILNMVGGGVQDVKLTPQELTFTVGKLVAKDYVSLDLKLQRQRYLSGPLTLADAKLWDPDRDRELPRHVKLSDQGARTKVTVSLAGLNPREKIRNLIYVIGVKVALKKDRLAGLIEDGALADADDAIHNAEFRELAPAGSEVLATTAGGVADIELSTARGSFTLGKVVSPDSLTVRLILKKDGVFGDKLIFDGHLKLGEANGNTRVVDAGNGRSRLLVDFSRLTLEERIESGKKYLFKVNANLNRDIAESILKPGEIYQAREAAAELKLKATP